jgi:hypothetical protein
VFLGNPKVLVEMMNTMHALQMFDNGEYMVITVDMETYSYREAFKYLWRKYSCHLNVHNSQRYRSCSALTPGTSYNLSEIFLLILVAGPMFNC